MSTKQAIKDYLDILTRESDVIRSAERPFQIYDGFYVSGPSWVAAQTALLDHFQKSQTPGFVRVFCKDVVKALRKQRDLLPYAEGLRARVEILAELEVHGNSDPRPRTLYHTSGIVATGTRRELAEMTGVSYARVRDILDKRRRFSKGWALTEAEARRGRLKPGRPKKQPKAPEPQEFFETGEASFF